MSKKQTLQAPKGMNDILPTDRPYWDFIFDQARSLLNWYGFERIETPVLEPALLFSQSIGNVLEDWKK